MRKVLLWCCVVIAMPLAGRALDLPMVINGSTVLELTEDIHISGTSIPFIISKQVGAQPVKLTITSRTGKAVIVSRKSTWDLTSFEDANKIIEFAGTARLVLEPGSTLRGRGGVLRFTNEAQCIVGRE